ncbi:MAG TPA: hypothetical protein VEZ11_18645 [Thermoanaerobaculia bacterium]|nr:hypothetical protein [Thermoanaerobaculia bacterium]
MNILPVVLSAFLAVPALAADEPSQPPRPQADILRIIAEPEAADCAVTPISRVAEFRGTLAAGDCTASDGTLFDIFQFQGNAGDMVTATVVPLTSGFRNPTLAMVPPIADGTRPPQMSGGAAATVTFVLNSTGSWRLGVGSTDPSSSGDYLLTLNCRPDPSPTVPQACLPQNLLCGQTLSYKITDQACMFVSSPLLLYTPINLYAVAGDVLNVQMLSPDFQPKFGIYDEHGGLPLLRSSTSTSGAAMTFTVPKSGRYFFAAYAVTDSTIGSFTLTLGCSHSGCIEPYFRTQPADVAVLNGQTASVALDVVAPAGPVSYEWYDVTVPPGDFPIQPPLSTQPVFKTPPITATRYYSVKVSTPCGSAISRVFAVSPALSRYRTVKR